MTLTSCLALLSVASCAALAQNAAGGPPPPTPVIYYAFVETDGEELPEGSVVVLEDILVLAPMESLEQIEQAPEARLEAALNAMIQDEGNAWTGEDLRVESVSLRDGHAEIELEGAIFGAGGIVLVAARTQILLTVFARPEVETATVTLDGDCIGNLGISHESEELPDDYEFTRDWVSCL